VASTSYWDRIVVSEPRGMTGCIGKRTKCDPEAVATSKGVHSGLLSDGMVGAVMKLAGAGERHGQVAIISVPFYRVLDSNLSTKMSLLTVFVVSPYSVWANSGMVPHNRPRPLLSRFLPLRYSPVILSLDDI